LASPPSYGTRAIYFSLQTIKYMVITFGNQKGGVGKTTLCTLFANYLAKKGMKTLVVDCDNQQTISEKRRLDIKKKPENNVPYAVQAFDINKVQDVSNMMRMIKDLDGTVLIDSPGSLTQQGLLPIFVSTDYVVCPFQYEPTSINSTVTFILFIQKLRERFPQMRAKLIFVVNRVDKRYGRFHERELWTKTEERLSNYGCFAPRVESKIDLQRYNTLEVSKEQSAIVTPTFDFILNKLSEEEQA